MLAGQAPLQKEAGVTPSLAPTATSTGTATLSPTYTPTSTDAPTPPQTHTATPTVTNTPLSTLTPFPAPVDTGVQRSDTVGLIGDNTWRLIPGMVLSGNFPAGMTVVRFDAAMVNAQPNSTVYAAITVDGVQHTATTWLTDTSAGGSKTIPLFAAVSLPASTRLRRIGWTNSS